MMVKVVTNLIVSYLKLIFDISGAFLFELSYLWIWVCFRTNDCRLKCFFSSFLNVLWSEVIVKFSFNNSISSFETFVVHTGCITFHPVY